MFSRPSATFLHSQYCRSTGLWTGLHLLNHPSAVMSTNFNILGRRKSGWSMAADSGWVHHRETQHVFYNKPVGKFFHSQCPNSHTHTPLDWLNHRPQEDPWLYAPSLWCLIQWMSCCLFEINRFATVGSWDQLYEGLTACHALLRGAPSKTRLTCTRAPKLSFKWMGQ